MKMIVFLFKNLSSGGLCNLKKSIFWQKLLQWLDLEFLCVITRDLVYIGFHKCYGEG